jgi:hypothetical protein
MVSTGNGVTNASTVAGSMLISLMNMLLALENEIVVGKKSIIIIRLIITIKIIILHLKPIWLNLLNHLLILPILRLLHLYKPTLPSLLKPNWIFCKTEAKRYACLQSHLFLHVWHNILQNSQQQHHEYFTFIIAYSV